MREKLNGGIFGFKSMSEDVNIIRIRLFVVIFSDSKVV
jgi:hypothetical protein